MLIALETFEEVPPGELTLPSGFLSVLEETLEKIDGCYEELSLSHVFLFGSVARGEGRTGSDLDLLLLTRAESEKAVRIMVLRHDLDDDMGDIPVQITVRKLTRFLDESTDVCGFHDSISGDLKLLRRYGDHEI